MKIFHLLVLCFAVLGAAWATLDEDTSTSDNEMIDAILTLVESRVVPGEDDRVQWAGGDAIRRIEDEFKWASESGFEWGYYRVYNECSDECMRTSFKCHGECKRDQTLVFTVCYDACRDTESACLTECLDIKPDVTGL